MRDFDQEQVDRLIELFPGPVTLTCKPPSPQEFLPWAWISAAIAPMFVIGGMATAGKNAHVLIAIGVACAVGAAITFLCIKVQSGMDRPLDTLVLDAEGFQTSGLGAIGSFSWRDVDTFYVVTKDEAPSRTAFRLFESDGSPRYLGRKHEFQRDYGLSARALASVMEAWIYAAWRHRNPPRYNSTAHG